MAYTPRSKKDFLPYAAGNKIYGGGRSFPTSGPVDKMGYKERDRQTSARKAAVIRRMKAKKNKRFMSADYLRSV